MKTSARNQLSRGCRRNQLSGTVTRLQPGAVNAEAT